MKKLVKYPKATSSTDALKETPSAAEPESETMVRTQIYLSRPEHAFLQAEAKRRDQPMAAVIRNLIDEKMTIPEDAWTNNPMFKELPPDPTWKGAEDGGLNHDFYIYGTPKRYIRKNGRWVKSPPLPKDYYSSEKSRRAYDALVNRKT